MKFIMVTVLLTNLIENIFLSKRNIAFYTDYITCTLPVSFNKVFLPIGSSVYES